MNDEDGERAHYWQLIGVSGVGQKVGEVINAHI
jgi:hypothetical protein